MVASAEGIGLVPIEQVLGKTRVPVKIWTRQVESAALDQLTNTANLPFVFHHVAAMPDVHLGVGATVGSVVATKGAVVPSAVGVDIGCGMIAQKTTVKAEALDGKLLRELRASIERGVPVGHESHKTVSDLSDRFFKANGIPKAMEQFPDLVSRARHQLGTLGGGNHFIEVCLDTEGAVWIMLHSGSRNVGKSTAEEHIGKAKKLAEAYHIALVDKDLAYLVEGTNEFSQYVSDLEWCQRYAMENREAMMDEVLKDFSHALGFHGDRSFLADVRVNCHHNYLSMEHHFGENVMVTRKGAIRARVGDMGIIPGSMGAQSFIVEGLGNPDSFNSAPHGAGRKMSRSAAKKKFTVEDLKRQTEGVECRKDEGVLDEIPGAYKPIAHVMEQSSDLVKVVAELKQTLCVKG